MSLYVVIRILIAVLLIAVILLINKKRPFIKKHSTLAIIIIACFSLSAVLHLIPFENAFVSFETPEEAANYYSNSDIENIIYGDSSCLILYKSETNARQILTKEENGWKIHTGFENKQSHMTLIDRTTVYVINLKNSTDQYIVIRDLSKNELNISDNIESVFYRTEDGTYFAYLSSLSNDYFLIIDGKECKLAD